MPFILQTLRAKQNREIKGHEYQLQAKIGQNYYSISNYMVLIRQNKGAKIILHAKSPTFMATKLKAFTVVMLAMWNVCAKSMTFHCSVVADMRHLDRVHYITGFI